MSKREPSQAEEEKFPGTNPVKKLRTSQSREVSVNSSLSPPKTRRNRTTNAFRINTSSNKPIQDSDDESKETIVMEKHGKVTELVLDSDSDMSYYSQDEEATTTNQTVNRMNVRRMPNVMFYLNMIPSQPQGDLITNIQKKWKRDYKKLDIHHGYIQWLFPNFFVAGYNKDAFKLTSSEAKIFRENEEIAERLIKSYQVFLDFLGIKLADKRSGRLERAPHFEERYRSTLVISPHNHVRVKRLLAHLNVVGFRHYAIELVNFLEVEIYGELGGYNKYLKEPKPIKGEYLRSVRINPLFAIIKYEIFKEWKAYGQAETPEEKELLYKCCFVSDESEFELSALFK